jgi:hypothetical protein
MVGRIGEHQPLGEILDEQRKMLLLLGIQLQHQ